MTVNAQCFTYKRYTEHTKNTRVEKSAHLHADCAPRVYFAHVAVLKSRSILFILFMYMTRPGARSSVKAKKALSSSTLRRQGCPYSGYFKDNFALSLVRGDQFE